MFRNIVMALVLVMLLLTGSILFAASGRQENVQVITSSGTTVIEFSQVVTEIYVVAMSTNPCYVSFTSTFTTTNDFVLGILDQTDVIEHVEEVQSSAMAITTSFLPVHVRVHWKYW